MKNVWEEARNRMNGPKTSQLHPPIQWRADAGEIKGKEGDDVGVKMVSRAYVRATESFHVYEKGLNPLLIWD